MTVDSALAAVQASDLKTVILPEPDQTWDQPVSCGGR
jgi:hypothetical protein